LTTGEREELERLQRGNRELKKANEILRLASAYVAKAIGLSGALMNNLMEISGFNKKYPRFALKDISFSLVGGEIKGFVGPNGAGKTTTIKAIMNLIRLDSGKMRVLGEDVSFENPKYREKISFVYDEFSYWSGLTIAEIQSILKRIACGWNSARFIEMCSEFALPEREKVKTFSKGMKTMLSLAVALSRDSNIIILDEPTSGLDPIKRPLILDLLKKYVQRRDRTVLFSTHITTDIERIADSVLFILGGHIVIDEQKEKLSEKYGVIRGDIEKIVYELQRDAKLCLVRGKCKSALVEKEAINNFRNSSRLDYSDASIEDIICHFVQDEYEKEIR